MNITKIIEKYIPTAEKSSPSVGKIVLKTAFITTAVLAVIPTVFKKTTDGFEGYGLLSTMKYEKKSREGGGYDMNFTYNMIDLERFGIKKADKAEEPEIIEAEAVEASVEAENTEA